jgi:hypothetical protein
MPRFALSASVFGFVTQTSASIIPHAYPARTEFNNCSLYNVVIPVVMLKEMT